MGFHSYLRGQWRRINRPSPSPLLLVVLHKILSCPSTFSPFFMPQSTPRGNMLLMSVPFPLGHFLLHKPSLIALFIPLCSFISSTHCKSWVIRGKWTHLTWLAAKQTKLYFAGHLCFLNKKAHLQLFSVSTEHLHNALHRGLRIISVLGFGRIAENVHNSEKCYSKQDFLRNAKKYDAIFNP